MNFFDCIIVGAGPGGSTAATFAARAGLRVLLIDKDLFPRDKICGDAISGKSMSVIKRLGMTEALQNSTSLPSWGVTFSGPYGDQVSIPFTKELNKPVAPGYICRREFFDALVFEQAQEAGATIWLQTTFTGFLQEKGTITGVTAKYADGAERQAFAPLVIGADGAYSVVAKKLGINQLDEAHYCGGLRVYYKGVTGFHPQNHVELHFVDEAVPGYFWIFPMPNGEANVGVGMLSTEIKKRKVKLKTMLDDLITHPRFRDRFTHAEAIGPVKGWGLPLGSRPRTMAGDGWLLLGDAASLIDPFTGEGIGNAMVSGEQAAIWAKKATDTQRYDAAFLSGYETEVLSILTDELRLSHWMQRLTNWKWLLNTVIAKASRDPRIADTISCMFDDHDQRKQLISPMFYLRLLMA
ncbi:MAG TPA: geranylgeranyl reductase family protein [Rhodothermales bacterium]|nr:geranylgeranyl reductase family protein [Rhodothermales bacterium]HRR10285.1 geranylgeranyl reductase family protein [Rhodothermales bacterium]